MDEVKVVPRHGMLGNVACLLVERLKDGKPGDIATDEDLSRVCGRDTRLGGKGYQSLRTAVGYVAKHYQVVWGRVTGEGHLKCLDASERVALTRSGLKSIRRKAGRTTHIVAAVDTTQLEPGQAKETTALAAQLGFIASFAGSQATKRLEEVETPKTPTLTDMLGAFK